MKQNYTQLPKRTPRAARCYYLRNGASNVSALLAEIQGRFDEDDASALRTFPFLVDVLLLNNAFSRAEEGILECGIALPNDKSWITPLPDRPRVPMPTPSKLSPNTLLNLLNNTSLSNEEDFTREDTSADSQLAPWLTRIAQAAEGLAPLGSAPVESTICQPKRDAQLENDLRCLVTCTPRSKPLPPIPSSGAQGAQNTEHSYAEGSLALLSTIVKLPKRSISVKLMPHPRRNTVRKRAFSAPQPPLLGIKTDIADHRRRVRFLDDDSLQQVRGVDRSFSQASNDELSISDSSISTPSIYMIPPLNFGIKIPRAGTPDLKLRQHPGS